MYVLLRNILYINVVIVNNSFILWYREADKYFIFLTIF